MNYFLDTYALIEIIKGNANYKKYLDSDFFTCIFNLYELYFILLKDFDEDTAKKFFDDFKDKTLEINEEDVFNASKIKLKNIKKRLSYADCLGYAISLRYGMKFLTGDKEFENFSNVEFVK